MGAMLIASGVIFVWSRTIYEQFTHLAGIAAPVEFQNLVTYKVGGWVAGRGQTRHRGRRR
jgi:hypothetical protein